MFQTLPEEDSVYRVDKTFIYMSIIMYYCDATVVVVYVCYVSLFKSSFWQLMAT